MTNNPIFQCEGKSCNKMNCIDCAGTAHVRHCEDCDSLYCSDCRLVKHNICFDAGSSFCDGSASSCWKKITGTLGTISNAAFADE